MSFKMFLKELNGERVEGKLVSTLFYSIICSIIFLCLFYYVNEKSIPNFIPKYGYYLFFAVLTYGLLTLTLKQVRAYKQFACMSGMMIGMTSGMIAGFMPGFLVGATNGMFVGGMFGMFVGIIFGIWNGKCCGIMGVMEGIMAGFMAGPMGAMTSVMLLNDHVKFATVVIFAVSALILISLNYMIYFEMKENEAQRKEGYFLAIVLSIILTAITTFIIVFGPRSFLFS